MRTFCAEPQGLRVVVQKGDAGRASAPNSERDRRAGAATKWGAEAELCWETLGASRDVRVEQQEDRCTTWSKREGICDCEGERVTECPG